MMKLFSVVLLGISLFAVLPAHADFEKGFNAYERGDYLVALREWRPLAEQGLAAAQTNLGGMYQHGQGVPQNYITALKWYRLAVEQGYALAQNNLGAMYQKGTGVPQNDTTAIRLFGLAAEQGNSLAQTNLGLMYQKGTGLPQNDTAAIRLFRLAAEQGHADAQVNLGAMYAFGKGTSLDYVEAYKWAHIGVTNGSLLGVKLRGFVGKKITDSQINIAQELARDCIGRNYEGCNIEEQLSEDLKGTLRKGHLLTCVPVIEDQIKRENMNLPVTAAVQYCTCIGISYFRDITKIEFDKMKKSQNLPIRIQKKRSQIQQGCSEKFLY